MYALYMHTLLSNITIYSHPIFCNSCPCFNDVTFCICLFKSFPNHGLTLSLSSDEVSIHEGMSVCMFLPKCNPVLPRCKTQQQTRKHFTKQKRLVCDWTNSQTVSSEFNQDWLMMVHRSKCPWMRRLTMYVSWDASVKVVYAFVPVSFPVSCFLLCTLWQCRCANFKLTLIGMKKRLKRTKGIFHQRTPSCIVILNMLSTYHNIKMSL